MTKRTRASQRDAIREEQTSKQLIYRDCRAAVRQSFCMFSGPEGNRKTDPKVEKVTKQVTEHNKACSKRVKRLTNLNTKIGKYVSKMYLYYVRIILT